MIRFRISFELFLRLTAGFALVCALAWPALAQEAVNITRADGSPTALRVYRPSSSGYSGCPPLALISPGLGGSETAYSYLARGLQEHGWLAIVMGHKESGPAALMRAIWRSGIRGGMLRMVTEPALQRDRFMDIAAALSWADTGCKRPYKVLLGHSMGSTTTMFEAGAANKLEVRGEDRFDAYVAISPSGPGPIFQEHAWTKIRKPVYLLTGTNDKGLDGTWEWRESPYYDLTPGCKWLGVIDGATHLNFAGIGFARTTKRLTVETVNAFLDAARNGRCSNSPTQFGMRLTTK
jgi:predicted dienelactone hydrolase